MILGAWTAKPCCSKLAALWIDAVPSENALERFGELRLPSSSTTAGVSRAFEYSRNRVERKHGITA
jgi:hypothetical protein